MSASSAGSRDLLPMDFGRRASLIRGSLRTASGAEAPIEALFLNDLTNVRWLTGFTGSNGWVVVSANDLALITDGRYRDQAEQQMAAAGVEGRVLVGATRAAMVDHLRHTVHHSGGVGFEATELSFADHRSFSAAIDVRWVPTSGMVEQHRRAKDAGELQRMAIAADIADAALADVAGELGDEPTEAGFRDALEAAMRAHGGDGPSFDTIVAAGANAALPHHHPDSTRIVEGMTVVVDFGSLFDGYHSDMTRTFTIGDPSPLQAEVYEVVLEAQVAGVAAVAPGARGRALDAVCRDRIAAAGWGDCFNHGTGHGVGLQIHESPWLTMSYDDTLEIADVVTVEPGVYRGDFGGVRIEDMVVVTTAGCQPLTKTPKDSTCLPSPPTI